jgi:hypothetical protein
MHGAPTAPTLNETEISQVSALVHLQYKSTERTFENICLNGTLGTLDCAPPPPPEVAALYTGLELVKRHKFNNKKNVSIY